MSTSGKATRNLFEASVTVERSFEDYGYDPQVEIQVNEPVLKIRVNRFQLDITRRVKANARQSRRPKVTKIDNRNFYGWFGRYFVDLYVEEPWQEDTEPYYFHGSGDWTEYHGRMVN